jgi:hypothetical protein
MVRQWCDQGAEPGAELGAPLGGAGQVVNSAGLLAITGGQHGGLPRGLQQFCGNNSVSNQRQFDGVKTTSFS